MWNQSFFLSISNWWRYIFHLTHLQEALWGTNLVSAYVFLRPIIREWTFKNKVLKSNKKTETVNQYYDYYHFISTELSEILSLLFSVDRSVSFIDQSVSNPVGNTRKYGHNLPHSFSPMMDHLKKKKLVKNSFGSYEPTQVLETSTYRVSQEYCTISFANYNFCNNHSSKSILCQDIQFCSPFCFLSPCYDHVINIHVMT